MPRFFVSDVQGDTIAVVGEDAAHISRVLRMRPGEQLTVCDGQGIDCLCEIISVEPNRVWLRICSRSASAVEPATRVHLYQCFPKGDKFEWIVQKAVELGVADITPVLSARCVARPDDKSARAKRERYQKIAAEAAKQSGRGRVPVVHDFLSFEKAVLQLYGQAAILFYENGGASLRMLLKSIVDIYAGQRKADAPPVGLQRSIALLIGPEGGFDSAEVAAARLQGVLTATLGPRILRTETAGLCAVSAVMYAFGELEPPSVSCDESRALSACFDEPALPVLRDGELAAPAVL